MDVKYAGKDGHFLRSFKYVDERRWIDEQTGSEYRLGDGSEEDMRESVVEGRFGRGMRGCA